MIPSGPHTALRNSAWLYQLLCMLSHKQVKWMQSGAAHTVTLILRKPPVPEFLSTMTCRLLGGVHCTRRYWMSILPPSIGAICSPLTAGQHQIPAVQRNGVTAQYMQCARQVSKAGVVMYAKRVMSKENWSGCALSLPQRRYMPVRQVVHCTEHAALGAVCDSRKQACLMRDSAGYLLVGQSLDIHVVRLTLRADIRDHDRHRALAGI